MTSHCRSLLIMRKQRYGLGFLFCFQNIPVEVLTRADRSQGIRVRERCEDANPRNRHITISCYETFAGSIPIQLIMAGHAAELNRGARSLAHLLVRILELCAHGHDCV